MSHRHPRNCRLGQHIQQECPTDILRIVGMASMSSRCVPHTSQRLLPACPADLSHRHLRNCRPGQQIQTFKEWQAWPKYPAGMFHRNPKNCRPGHHTQQKCATDIPGSADLLANIISRGVPRHPKNCRPGQHAQQKCVADIPETVDLASTFSGGVPQTSQELETWPGYSAEASGLAGLASIFRRSVAQISRELQAWPTYSAEACHRHSRN